MKVVAFHKPKGVVVTTNDERERKTVYDLLPDWMRREDWVPVGRLDRDTKGLLLFVQDHSLVDLLTRPGQLEKEYEVFVRGHAQPHHLEEIVNGIDSPVGLLKSKHVSIEGYIGPKTRLRVVLTEGKNLHIRRMFGALHDDAFGTPLKVIELKRIRFGPIPLDIPSGAWRFLTESELSALASVMKKKRD